MNPGNNTRSSIILPLFTIYFLCIAIYNPEVRGFNLSNYILLVTLTVSLFRFGLSLRVKRRTLVSIVLFYTAILISGFQSLTIEGFITLIKVFIPLCLYAVCSKVMSSPFQRDKVIKIFAVVNISACLTGMVKYYVLNDYGYTMIYLNSRIGRMRGSFLQPNVFATFLAITFPFGWCFFWNSIISAEKPTVKTMNRILLVLDLLINVFCVYLSRSRWSMLTIGMLVIMLPLALTKRRSRNSTIISIVGSVVAVICIVLVLYTNTNINRYFGYRLSNDVRKNAIVRAIELSKENAFFGLGLNHGIGGTLDSTIMNLLVDTGWIGLILYIGLCVICFIELLKIYKYKNDRTVLPFILMFFVFCIEMIGESILYNSLINCFLGVVWFLCLQDSKQIEKA